MKFIKVDVINGYFSFDFAELCAYYNIREDIVWIDSITEDQMYHAPFDYISSIEINPDLEEVKNRKVMIEFNCNCNHADKNDLALLKKFHYSWFNELRDYLKSNDFRQFLILINKHKDIFPKKDLIFSEFLTNLNKVKGVWIGESPYPNHQHSMGRSFATWDKKTPKSLSIIIDGIIKDLNLTHYKLSNDMSELSLKGICFLNYALVIDKDKKLIESSTDFIRQVIKVLNKKEKLSVICFGNYAKKLVPLFSEHISVFSTEHPIVSLYEKRDWNTNNVFKNFNEKLNIELK